GRALVLDLLRDRRRAAADARGLDRDLDLDRQRGVGEGRAGAADAEEQLLAGAAVPPHDLGDGARGDRAVAVLPLPGVLVLRGPAGVPAGGEEGDREAQSARLRGQAVRVRGRGDGRRGVHALPVPDGDAVVLHGAGPLRALLLARAERVAVAVDPGLEERRLRLGAGADDLRAGRLVGVLGNVRQLLAGLRT